MRIPYPQIEIAVWVGSGSESYVHPAIPDTGFSGDVLIPFGVGREIVRVGKEMSLQLPSRQVFHAKSWPGRVMLETKVFRARVAAFGDDYVIGRGILDQLEISFQFGKRVRLNFERPAE